MKRLYFLSLFSLVLLMGSCIKEDPPEPVGEAKVRFLNAALGSAPQDMYINGGKVANSVALEYGTYSPFTTILSGGNLYELSSDGKTASASIAYSGVIGGSYTVVFFQLLKSQSDEYRAGVLVNDTEPVAGKAKVRFAHLNRYLERHVKILDENNQVLTEGNGLEFAQTSKYFVVEPGMRFTATATDVTDSPVIDLDLQAGKNYTVWLDGETGMQLRSHKVIDN
ncbi:MULTISPECIES: DUF4397 domain-containing protein [Pedobacter]|uniref:DUF4397 domain-containing protein n=1 Tax=Pedobacter TaxID=84567 RepID=UPI00210A894F|nr:MULTISPECIES: DUF4397 domain-containing protein [unclassified Pedobacter]